MQPNVNPETGIRYGIISANSLDGELVQDLLYYEGEDLSWKEAEEEIRNEVNALVEEGTIDEDDVDREVDDRLCDVYIDEPIVEGECEGVKYCTSWLGGALHFWIFESPRIGLYSECSPCCPNAGNLDSPNDDGVECYDVPEGWRENE